MVVKVKEFSEKTRHAKNIDKSKKYILRGHRNTRYHERNLISFLKRTISFLFVRARTFTRTFDRGVVRRQNIDLKFCRRIFYYAAGKKKMCMNFLLVEWKNDDDFFISGEEKKRGVAEQ